MIKMFGVLFFLFSIGMVGSLQAQQSDSIKTKRPYGGIMLPLDGFYEVNLSEKFLFVGRIGNGVGWESYYGWQYSTYVRPSLRWLLSKRKRGAATFNSGWYTELATTISHSWRENDRYMGSSLAILAGYRGKVGKRFILEGSCGYGSSFYFDKNRKSGAGVVYHLGIGFVLFSGK